MAKDFQQTDTAIGLSAGVACSGAGGTSSTTGDCLATDGGTAGTTEDSPLNGSGAGNLAAYFIEIDPAEDVPSGDHTVRLDVTTANGDISVEEIHVCYWDDSLSSYEDLGGVTTFARALGTAQVETFALTGMAAASVSYATGDRLFYVVVMLFGQNHGNASVGITPNQLVTTPLPAGGPPERPFMRRPNPLLRM